MVLVIQASPRRIHVGTRGLEPCAVEMMVDEIELRDGEARAQHRERD
jgi:hypothetical protein